MIKKTQAHILTFVAFEQRMFQRIINTYIKKKPNKIDRFFIGVIGTFGTLIKTFLFFVYCVLNLIRMRGK